MARYRGDVRTGTYFRFHDKVLVGGGCWEWQCTADRYGYGVFKMHPKMVKAHRFSYETHVDSIPDGMLIMHSCDNRKCVNPKHLSAGTAADNMEDKKAKGRARGPVPLS